MKCNCLFLTVFLASCATVKSDKLKEILGAITDIGKAFIHDEDFYTVSPSSTTYITVNDKCELNKVYTCGVVDTQTNMPIVVGGQQYGGDSVDYIKSCNDIYGQGYSDSYSGAIMHNSLNADDIFVDPFNEDKEYCDIGSVTFIDARCYRIPNANVGKFLTNLQGKQDKINNFSYHGFVLTKEGWCKEVSLINQELDTNNNNNNTNNNNNSSSNNEKCGKNIISQGYKCCSTCTDAVSVDSDGLWGVENGEWCGIPDRCDTCSADIINQGYRCCSTCSDVVFVDSDGQWGVENDDWCAIPYKCNYSSSSLTKIFRVPSKDKCLYAPAKKGQYIQMKDCDDSVNTKWMVSSSGKGRIQSQANPNLCISVNQTNDRILLDDCDDSDVFTVTKSNIVNNGRQLCILTTNELRLTLPQSCNNYSYDIISY